MNEKGLYPTLGTSIGPVKVSKYKGEDLDPWETNYSITQENGVGLFLPDDKRGREDCKNGFPKRNSPKYLPLGSTVPTVSPRRTALA